MNTLIELHDSRVSAVAWDGDLLVVSLTPAYLHKSNGQPEIDPGTGWTQNARLLIGGASLVGDLPELPCDLWDGELTFGGEIHSNGSLCHLW